MLCWWCAGEEDPGCGQVLCGCGHLQQHPTEQNPACSGRPVQLHPGTNLIPGKGLRQHVPFVFLCGRQWEVCSGSLVLESSQLHFQSGLDASDCTFPLLLLTIEMPRNQFCQLYMVYRVSLDLGQRG